MGTHVCLAPWSNGSLQISTAAIICPVCPRTTGTELSLVDSPFSSCVSSSYLATFPSPRTTADKHCTLYFPGSRAKVSSESNSFTFPLEPFRPPLFAPYNYRPAPTDTLLRSTSSIITLRIPHIIVSRNSHVRPRQVQGAELYAEGDAAVSFLHDK